jgi:hypothetical protein
MARRKTSVTAGLTRAEVRHAARVAEQDRYGVGPWLANRLRQARGRLDRQIAELQQTDAASTISSPTTTLSCPGTDRCGRMPRARLPRARRRTPRLLLTFTLG